MSSLESRFLAYTPTLTAVEYGSPAPTIAFFIANSTRWYRVSGGLASIRLFKLLRGCPKAAFRFRGFECDFVPTPLYRVELFIASRLPLSDSPAALDLCPFRDKTQGDLHPFIRTEPLGLKFERIPKDHFRVAHFPCSWNSG